METQKVESTNTNLIDAYCRNWLWRSVECLLEVEQDPRKIAEKLSTSIGSVYEALDGLVELKLASREASGYKKIGGQYLFNLSHLGGNEWLKIQSTLAPMILSKLTNEDKFSTWFFLGDQDLVKEYSKKFVTLYKEMIDEGVRRGCKEVMASEISFAQMIEGGN